MHGRREEVVVERVGLSLAEFRDRLRAIPSVDPEEAERVVARIRERLARAEVIRG